MRQVWNYPMLVSAVPHSLKEERLCLLSAEHEFDLHEVGDDQIEMLATTQKTDSLDTEDGTDFALIDGYFYARNRDPWHDEMLEIEREAQDLLSYGHTTIYEPISTHIMQIMSQHEAKLWPPKAKRSRQHGCSDSLDTNKVSLLPKSGGQVAYWRERMQERLNTVRIQGDKVWHLSTEPVFALDLDTNEAFLVPFGQLSEDPLKNRALRIYSAGDEDVMLKDAIESEGVVGSKIRFEYTPRIVSPSLASTESETLDLVHQARTLCRHVSEALATQSTASGQMYINEAPSTLIMHWTAIRDAVGKHGNAPGNIHEASVSLSQIVWSIEEASETSGVRIAPRSALERYTQSLANWGNRIISLETAPSVRTP